MHVVEDINTSGVGPLHVPSTASFAYVTGLFMDSHKRDAVGLTLISICSLLASTGFGVDVVALVDELADRFLRTLLDGLGVHVIRVARLAPPARWATPNPRQLFSFSKFHAWRLLQFDRFLWFDIDVIFYADPRSFVRRYSGAEFAAMRFPDGLMWKAAPQHPRCRHINSGVVIARPSLEAFAGLVIRWHAGAYRSCIQEPGHKYHSIQDVLSAATPGLLGELTPMDACENFRGYHFQEHCRRGRLLLVHGRRFFHMDLVRRLARIARKESRQHLPNRSATIFRLIGRELHLRQGSATPPQPP